MVARRERKEREKGEREGVTRNANLHCARTPVSLSVSSFVCVRLSTSVAVRSAGTVPAHGSVARF